MSSFAGDFATIAASDVLASGICAVLEITLNDATWGASTALNLSDSVAAARGKGYLPNITEWSDPEYSFDLKSSNLTPLEIRVTVADEDFTLRDALENGNQRGSAAVIYWVVPGNATDYATRFTGILDRWEYRAGEVALYLRTDDAPLRSTMPRRTLVASEWPALPAASKGLPQPLVYGVHNSSGLSAAGMLRAIPVNWVAATTGWYLVSLGSVKLVRAVYKNGALQTYGVDYLPNYSGSAAGTQHTSIVFLGGHIPAEGDEITADVDGYEVSGNTASGTTPPTGALITNPVEQIRHAIVTHGENGWTGGAWVTASSLLDESSWAEAAEWAALHVLEGAGYVGTVGSLGDLLNSWLDTWTPFRACWTPAGRVALHTVSLEWPGYRTATDPPLLRTESERTDGELSYVLDTTDITDSVVGGFLYDEVAGQYVGSLTVQDPDVGAGVQSNTDLLWAIRRAV
jgi:hypothetical protein